MRGADTSAMIVWPLVNSGTADKFSLMVLPVTVICESSNRPSDAMYFISAGVPPIRYRSSITYCQVKRAVECDGTRTRPHVDTHACPTRLHACTHASTIKPISAPCPRASYLHNEAHKSNTGQGTSHKTVSVRTATGATTHTHTHTHAHTHTHTHTLREHTLRRTTPTPTETGTDTPAHTDAETDTAPCSTRTTHIVVFYRFSETHRPEKEPSRTPLVCRRA